MDEAALKEELLELDKERLVDLFIKLKKINLKLCNRLDKVENQLNELTNLDSLIDDLPD